MDGGRTLMRGTYRRNRLAYVTAVDHDPATSVLTATFADGTRLEYASVREATYRRLASAELIDLAQFTRKVALRCPYRRPGEPEWQAPPSLEVTGAPPVRLGRVLETFLIGRPPTHDRAPGNRARATRATAKHVSVTTGGVTWRSRTRRLGRLETDEVAHVRLVEVQYPTDSGFHGTVFYALVIDDAGTVRLRVTGNSYWSIGPDRRRFRDMWEPLGLPTAITTPMKARAKDARREWPEAFSFARAYPFVTTALIIAGWMALIVPVLSWLLGS